MAFVKRDWIDRQKVTEADLEDLETRVFDGDAAAEANAKAHADAKAFLRPALSATAGLLDTLTTSGVHPVTSSATATTLGLPGASMGYVHHYYANSSYAKQTWVPMGGLPAQERILNSGTWGAWGPAIPAAPDELTPAKAYTDSKAWLRPALTTSTSLDVLSVNGVHPVSSSTTASTLGLPYPSMGYLQNYYVNSSYAKQTWTPMGGLPAVERVLNAGTWGPWRRLDAVPSAGLANGLLVEDFTRRRGAVTTGGVGAVALRFDHGLSNFNTIIRPLLEARGIPYSLALNSRAWDQAENTGVTAADVNTWVQGGLAEVWNHGAHHSNADGSKDLEDTIVAGLSELRSQLPAAVIDGFAVPGVGTPGYGGFNGGATPESFYSTEAGRLILANHAVSSGYIPDTAHRTLDGVVRQGQGHYTLDAASLAGAQVQIDQAIADSTGLQLMLHPSVVNTTDKITTATLTAVLDYIVAKRDAGDLVVLSPYDLTVADADLEVEAARAAAAADATSKADTAESNANGYTDGKAWYRGFIPSGADLTTLQQGDYYVNTYSVSQSIVPTLPEYGGGVLTVHGASTYRVIEWSPVGVATSPKPVWRNEYNSGNSTWYGWHRIDVGAAPAAETWVKTALASGASLDTLTTPGIYTVSTYSIANSLVGRPSNITGAINPATVEVLPGASGRAVQRWAVYASTGAEPVFVQRQRNSLSEWSAWRRLDDVAPSTRAAITSEINTAVANGPSSTLDRAKIVVYGDSQSEVSSGASWPEQIAAILDGNTITNHAKSGDTSDCALITAGVTRPVFTVAGDTIPADAVAVNISTLQDLGTYDGRRFAGYLAGVYGMWNVTATGHTFTRAAAGTAVSVSGGAEFVSSLAPGDAKTVVFWFGGNNFSFDKKGTERTYADHVIGQYRRVVEWGAREGRNVFVAGTTNRLNALTGSTGFAEVQEINRTLRTIAPDLFMDVQAYYSEHALTDAGFTPTTADTEAMSRGEIPPQLYLDGDQVHLKTQARAAIAAHWLAPWFAAKGVGLASGTLEPLPVLTVKDEA